MSHSSVSDAGFALSARLGASLARPFHFFAPDAWSLGVQSPAEMLSFARHPAFARPVERALATERAGSLALSLSAAEIEGALQAPEGRLAVLLVSEPLERITRVGLLCAAVAMQRLILAQAQKQERQRIRAVLGPDTFTIATQEAPALYPSLAELGSASTFATAVGMQEDELARANLAGYGTAILRDLIQHLQPGFAPLFTARLSKAAQKAKVDGNVGAQARQLLKLVRRRVPEWSPIIG